MIKSLEIIIIQLFEDKVARVTGCCKKMLYMIYIAIWVARASGFIPNSCADWLANGDESGMYTIEGGLEVNCDFVNMKETFTIQHDFPNHLVVQGYEASNSYVKTLTYTGKTIAEVRDIVERYTDCHYDAYIKCWGIALYTHTSWVDYAGTPHTYAASILSGSLCYYSDVRECNCRHNDMVWNLDNGTMIASNFPISQLRFGDNGDNGESMEMNLGPLVCEKTIPELVEEPQYRFATFNPQPDKRASSTSAILHHNVPKATKCSLFCNQRPGCSVFNYHAGDKVCELILLNAPYTVNIAEGWSFFDSLN